MAAINKGIEGIPRDRVRLHVCYGNWEGPHIHDIPLATILPVLYQANVGALSIEFSNPRHAHEYEALKAHPLPKDMLLIPGVIETTTNFVEHPQVVARRIEEAVAAVGDRERVIASTDCGFGTFTNREWVIEPVVWLKLKSLREGADIASAQAVGPGVADPRVFPLPIFHGERVRVRGGHMFGAGVYRRPSPRPSPRKRGEGDDPRPTLPSRRDRSACRSRTAWDRRWSARSCP